MTKTRIEKWWDETFAPKKKKPASVLAQLMRRPKRAPQFADKRMQRGVQVAKAKKQVASRLAFIYGSMRQGNVLAVARREDYLRRRGSRWRGLIEHHMPRMFAEAMQGMGLTRELKSGAGVKELDAKAFEGVPDHPGIQLNPAGPIPEGVFP